ncbi:unnamed protein product [Leptidea sinapis]|uniref:Uncharacterized protein n=1 Tax=Leptidea sinapis TaxID=189913 RepID=A0A5E4QCJ8_9NEOP|nr:unnamed protein product [Leptidea sinapis]
METERTMQKIPISFAHPEHHSGICPHLSEVNIQPGPLIKQECKKEIDIVEHELPGNHF